VKRWCIRKIVTSVDNRKEVPKPHCVLANTTVLNFQQNRQTVGLIQTSVADPDHFDMDPDPHRFKNVVYLKQYFTDILT
jgi:hypothetical protein